MYFVIKEHFLGVPYNCLEHLSVLKVAQHAIPVKTSGAVLVPLFF